MINEVKVGFNGSKTRVSGLAPVRAGINLNGLSAALNGVAALDGTSGYALPSGLLRISTAFNGSAAPYTNHSLSFIDNLTITRGNHNIKMGVEFRPQQIKNAILGGVTYTFPNTQSFLNAAPSQIAINGNTNDISPFTGKGGFFDMRQTFYIGYIQDEWRLRSNLTMSYGLRYEYYSPLKEQNDKVLWFDVR
jgi:outer membrane receptor protein involved in Fe transport